VRQYFDLRIRLDASGGSGAPQRRLSPRTAEREGPARVVKLAMLAGIVNRDFEHCYGGSGEMKKFDLSLYRKIGYGDHLSIERGFESWSITAEFCLFHPVNRYHLSVSDWRWASEVVCDIEKRRC
jgi:hypothetical protein